MSEHSPAPTFSRSVYGFVLYLVIQTFFIIYCIWAIVPTSVLQNLHLTYLPQKHWAIALPVLFLNVLALFVFCIYPSLGLCMTPAMNDPRTISNKNINISNKHSIRNVPNFNYIQNKTLTRNKKVNKKEINFIKIDKLHNLEVESHSNDDNFRRHVNKMELFNHENLNNKSHNDKAALVSFNKINFNRNNGCCCTDTCFQVFYDTQKSSYKNIKKNVIPSKLYLNIADVCNVIYD